MDIMAIKSLTDVQKVIKTWCERAFLVGASTIGEIPSGHRVVVNFVQVDPDEPGIVYPTGNSKKVRIDGHDEWIDILGLGNTVRRRIGQAAGLSWIPELSGRIDDGSNPRRITFIKACSYRDLMGETRTQTGTYELDFDKREADLVQSKLKTYEKNCQKTYKKSSSAPTEGEIFRSANPDGQKWAEEAARVDIMRMMVHGLQRAETGAENRAIAAALGLRCSGYTAAELKAKPFAVFRLVDDIDWANDPQAHAAQILQASGLAKLIAFGGQVNSLRSMLLPSVAAGQPVIAAPAPVVPVMAPAPGQVVEDPDEPDEPDEVLGRKEDAPVPPEEPKVAAAAVPPVATPGTVDQNTAPEAMETAVPQFGQAYEIPTIETFRTLTRAERQSFVQMLLITRECKPTTKNVADLDDNELLTWFEGLLTRPLKGTAAAGVQA